MGDRGPPIGRTLGLVLSLKPRYHHTRRQGRWWLWAGRWSTTCGRISDECSWLDVSRARVMPVKPLGESPLLLGDEVAKEGRGGRVELAQSLSLSIPSPMRKRMRPISLRIYAPVCLLHPQKAQSASFVHRGQDGLLSTTADLRAQGDRRAVKVSTKAGRQVGAVLPVPRVASSGPKGTHACTGAQRGPSQSSPLRPNPSPPRHTRSCDQPAAHPNQGSRGVPQWGCVLYRRHAHHLIAHSSSPKTQIWEVPHLGRPSTTHLFGRE